MPMRIKTADAIYLGEFGDMSLGFPDGNAIREDVAGFYGAPGSGTNAVTVRELSFRGFESFEDPNLFDNDFYVDRFSLGHGIAEGVDSGAFQPVTYIHQNTLVSFTTTTGGFLANMNFFQLEDGSVYMMANPQESPTSSFRFENAAAGQEITGFSVPLLDTSDNGFPPNEGDWLGTAFPDPNQAPTAIDDFATVIEGDSVTINVLSNDTDPEGGDLDILGTPTAANGTVSVNNETGAITYTPNPGFSGTDTITYTAVDEGGLTDTATLTITVEAAAANQIVDGENTGEVMNPGYNDALGATNSGGDIIDGADGINDVILGNGGNDTIDAGLGADEVYGGSGDDVIDGGAGNDILVGDFGGPTDVVVDPGTRFEGTGNENVTVTINSQAGANDGAVLVEVTDINGNVSVETLTSSYDSNIGQTFSLALDPGDTIRVGITAGGGTPLWSDEVSAAQATGLGDGTVQLNFEDEGGSDFQDVVLTADVDGAVGLKTTAGTISDGSVLTPIDGIAGDDTLHGGNGDDVIYGDSAEDVTPTDEGFFGPRESFNWQLVSQGQADSSVTQNTGSVNVTYSEISETGQHESAIENNTFLNVAGIDAANDGLDNNSSLFALGLHDGDRATYRWNFDEVVANVEFNVNDVDVGSVVTVWAYGPDGNRVPANFAIGSAMGQWDNQFWSEGSDRAPTANENNAQITIAGPVTRIEVEHWQHGSSQSGVYITDLHFDTGFQEASDGFNGIGGDDVIKGDLGADQMFGEGGDDTFLVASAEEGAGDVITGGNGPDQTTDNDVLDLRGAGVVDVASTADATDAGALTGTITFKDGTTLDFSQIETILQDTPALTIAPAPSTPIDPATGLPVTQENGEPVELVVTRNTPTDDPLVVTIQNGDPSETNPPITVTIPAGEDSVSFLVDPVDDPEVDGDQTAPITVTAPGFAPDTQDVLVEDDDATGNQPPVAVDDNRNLDYDTYAADADGLVNIINVTRNDSDPDGDPFTVVAAGGDTTPDPRNGWYDWIDASDGGQIRVNVNGKSQFRGGEDFAELPVGESVTTSIEYTIADPDGATSTATVSLTMTGTAAGNQNPVAVDDMAKLCATEAVDIDVLANDTDPDGDIPILTHIDGVDVMIGDSVTLASGAVVTFNADGTLGYDSSAAVYDVGGVAVGAADLLIGTMVEDTFEYSISDGLGGSAVASVNVDVVGGLNTLGTIDASLAAAGCVDGTLDFNDTIGAELYTFNVGTVEFADTHIAEVLTTIGSIDLTFCLSIATPIDPAPTVNEFDVAVLDAASYSAAMAGATDLSGLDSDFGFNPENIDNVNWLLNEADSLISEGFTEGDIQRAIWNLVDGGDDNVLNGANANAYFDARPWFGDEVAAAEITSRALANDGFEAGSGDIVGVVLDPKVDGVQPLVIGVEFDTLAQDCDDFLFV